MNPESLVISGKSLGAGGFGTVFMGQLDEMNVAVKKLSRSEKEIDNLVGEASKLKKLRLGKHIAYTHGIILKDENLYMVMEYGRFGDLKSFLNRNAGSVTHERKMLFCRGILLGLLYCHSMNVFHGDIKCSNVILGKNLEPKLTDFGLSMTVDNIKYYSKLYDGSLHWVAPELFSIKEDEAVYPEFITDPYPCDVYSLGATFCEISYDGTTEFIDSDDPGTDISVGIVSPMSKNAFLEEIVDRYCQFERNERISLECCFDMLEKIAEEQLLVSVIDDKWQEIQQDIKANSKLKLPLSFILHRPMENLVVGPSNLSLLEWLCINNCTDAVEYMIQLHKQDQDQDQIKWLYEISELCESSEVADFLQTLIRNSKPSRLVLSSLIDNHPQQFIEILIKAGASSYSYSLLKKAIERHHNMIVQAIIDSRGHLKEWAAYNAVKFGNAKAVKILANAGADLGCEDYLTGYTPLKIAIETENIKIVRILLEHGVDVNSESGYTWSGIELKTQYRPLYLAAIKGNREIVKLLINARATVNITSSEWHSMFQSLEQQGDISMARFICNSISKRSSSVENNSLCAAIRDKQPDLVQILISDREKIDGIGLDGYAPLHWAVIVGNEEVFKSLIGTGADLDIRTLNEAQTLHSATDYFSECTPLHIALSKKYLGIARLLVEASADFSAKNGLQQTIMDIAKGNKEEIEKLIMECAPVNAISIRRAMRSMSYESVKIMIKNQQVNAEILSECLCIAVSSGRNDLVKYLLQCGASVNEKHQGNTPLWWAIFWGNIQAMGILINAGVNINTENSYWELPLFQCVRESQVDMVQLLVDNGADVNARDKDGNEPIHCVSDKDIMSILINASADINAKDQYGTTCLIERVRKSDTEMVQFLLDQGADGNARDKDGNAPIHYAMSKEIIKILINAGAIFNVKDQYGAKCLIHHVFRSNTEMVQFLVDKGVDVNASDKNGSAPIHCTKNKEIMRILINAGADINVKDLYGRTLLTQCVKNSNAEMVQFLLDQRADVNARDQHGNAPIHYVKSKEIMRILINTGADINAKDQYGETCLIERVRKLDKEMIQFLLDQGADVNARDEDGNTPADYANDKDTLEILINAGADINVENQHGAACLIQYVKKSDTEMVQFLVDKGADVNARNKDGNAPIHYAKNKEIMRILINAGADINAKGPYGETCLIERVRKLDKEMIQFLLDQGADVNARDEDEYSPIHFTNDMEITRILINASANINAKDQYGETCLIKHVRNSNIEMVQFLLDKGADGNSSDKDGYSTIHFTNDKKIMRILINAGANINAKDQYKETCLILYVKKSDVEMVQFLLDHGADVNARDQDENAPIHYAKSKEITRILINAGADINAKDQYGVTCLIHHVSESDTEMVQFLLDQGVDVNARDKDGNLPIHYANSKTILKILIDASADINAKDQYGTTCLIQYVSELDTEMVQFLVDKGVDVNARDKDGNVPIHYAMKKEIIRILINAGADINAKDQYGTTCLIKHVSKSDTEMVQFLVDKGVDVNARDEDKNMPIHFVRDKEIAEILITANANINVKDRHGKELFDILVEEQNKNLSSNQYDKKKICELLEYLKVLR